MRKKVLERIALCVMALMLIGLGRDVKADSNYSVSNPHVLVYQIYGGKGESEVISHDFIELYNPTGSAADLKGWSLQCRGPADKEWQMLPLSGSIPSKHSFLIRCKATSVESVGKRIEKADLDWDITLNNKGLSVVLLSNSNVIPKDSKVFDADKHQPVIDGYVDMLSAGGKAGDKDESPRAFETGFITGQSKKKAVARKTFTDTDNNEADTELINLDGSDTSTIPHSTKDGEWGKAPIDRLVKARKNTPNPKMYTDYGYCSNESAKAFTAVLAEVDNAIKRRESDESVISGLEDKLSKAKAALEYKIDAKVPQVYIATNNGEGTKLTKSTGYVGASVVIADTDGHLVVNDFQTEIKVRGNSTADDEIPKKPYLLNLSNKVAMFDNTASKKWILLADYSDPTLTRNRMALYLAGQLGVCASQTQRVEVWMDGSYRGAYLLTEKIEDTANVGKDGFLVEMDDPSTKEGHLYFNSASGKFYRLREPEKETSIEDVKKKMDHFESLIESGDYAKIESEVDINSFVNNYIFTEFIKNYDYEGRSVYFYYKDGKYYAGPAWDYDTSAGARYLHKDRKDRPPEESYIDHCHYYEKLMQQAWFTSMVKARYKAVSALLESIYKDGGWIDKEISDYTDMITRNFSTWEVTNSISGLKTPQENVDYMKTWLSQRKAWFDTYAEGLKDAPKEVSKDQKAQTNKTAKSADSKMIVVWIIIGVVAFLIILLVIIFAVLAAKQRKK